MSRRIQSGHCTDALCLAVKTNAFLKTKMCPRLESCSLGKNCSFAHSDKELRPLPQFKKTAICYNYRRGKCLDPECRFAHGEEDMIGYSPVALVQPRRICPYFILNACHDSECPNTHMISRRAASRLKTFLVALRNTLLSFKQAFEEYIDVAELKRRLKGGIPWQSLGFAAFKDAVLFLPGTRFLGDETIQFNQTSATRELLQRLQTVIDSQKQESEGSTPSPVLVGRNISPSVTSSGHFGILEGLPEDEVVSTPGATELFGLPQQAIRPDQVVGATADFFICPVCEGIAIHPLIADKCSHVVCKLCLEIWRALDQEKAFACPKCHSIVEPQDVNEISVDSPCPTAAALAVIYDSIQVRCDKCEWTGSPPNYSLHACQAQTVTPKSGSFVAVDDFEEVPPGLHLLPLKRGDRLELEAESESGWAFVKRATTNESGWTPASYLSPVSTVSSSEVRK
jgi:hypothetical protein